MLSLELYTVTHVSNFETKLYCKSQISSSLNNSVSVTPNITYYLPICHSPTGNIETILTIYKMRLPTSLKSRQIAFVFL